MAQIQYKFNKNDEYFTPSYAVYPIIERLKAGTTVWCPFDKKESEFVRILTENGFNVIYGHIQNGQDFFKVDVPECDYIVSNPPYSLKSAIFRRLYEIGKPFAMLINLQGIFDSQERFKMFMKNRVEIIWLSPRVNYITESGEYLKGVPFQSGYICSGICSNQLEFVPINREYLTGNNSTMIKGAERKEMM